jgi:transforming growth factor-beta-induced protein
MKMLLRYTAAFAVVALMAPATRAADIVDTAVGAGSFKTLAAALGAADLVDTLKGDGPFTVFAPTDEAFKKLPEGTVAELLKPENKAALAGILTYHVVPGSVMAEQVVKLTGATTVNGQRVDIKAGDNGVMVDGAKVLTTDIKCDNGVIHVIDSVILPADKTIPETASAAGSFGTLLAAVGAGGLAETLGSAGPFTVFAPTDEAFGALPAGTIETLLKPENKQQLVDILTYHVIPGRVYSPDALAAKNAKTLQGTTVAIAATESGASVNGARLLTTDLDASNGVIHVIDRVLIPTGKKVDAKKMIFDAISTGVPMYNAGHHAQCANLYQRTMETVMASTTDSEMRSHMKMVLTAAKRETCPMERAWTLRRGMDQMYVRLP